MVLVYYKWVVECSRSLSVSALLSRSMRSLVGGDVIELTLCIIWYFYSLVCVWCSLVPRFLSLGLSNLSQKCGNDFRSIGVESDHNWNYGVFTLVIRVTNYHVETYPKLNSNVGFSFPVVSLSRNDYSSIKSVQEWCHNSNPSNLSY